MNRNMFIALQGIAWGIIIVFIIMFSTGCSTMTAEFGSGGGATIGASNEINLGSGERIQMTQLEARIGTIVPLTNTFDLHLAIGPNLVIPTDSHDNALGLDGTIRVLYNDTYPRPYVGLHIGASYMFNRWEEQATDWGFTLGPIVGTEFKINESSSILVEYRFWHESNGSKMFGTRRPNPGYNADTAFILWQIKFGNNGN